MRQLAREFVMKECPTHMCHASTLLVLDQDTVLCAWFGGRKEGEEDVDIWMSRREKGIWSTPIVVTKEADVHWNPVLFQNNKNEIFLFYKLGKRISTWKTMIMKSLDGGNSFTEPQEMVEGDKGGRGPVRNKPIRLSNGRIIAPGSLEDGIWSAFVDISDDDGKTWIKSNKIIIKNLHGSTTERTVDKSDTKIPVSEQSFFGRGVIQPTLWEGKVGQVHMLLRSSERNIYRSDSDDWGETWTNAYKTKLPNNNSGIDLAKLDDGTLVLVYNPVSKNWGPRTPISVAISTDNGDTWSKQVDLDSGEGEFAYPAIVKRENQVYITYTWKRQNIAFWQFEI